jgi:hypothetical protein
VTGKVAGDDSDMKVILGKRASGPARRALRPLGAAAGQVSLAL